MAKLIRTFDNVPVWALYALEYGTSEDQRLSAEDKTQINDFIAKHFPNGYYMEIDWDSMSFDAFPAFGLPCDVVKVDFYL